MKRRPIYLVIAALLVLLLLASIPRIDGVESVGITYIQDHPVLYEAYLDLCAERPLFSVSTQDTFQIVTVRNLWGTWQRYILPCFAADTHNIPRAGNADFTAFLHILSPWDQENLFTKLCPLKLDVFGVNMTPGENVMVYQLAEIVPNVSSFPNDMRVNANEFSLRIKHNCDKAPSLFVHYTLATLNSAHQRDQLVTSEFTWSYHLRMFGYEFEKGTFTLSKEHTVNA